VCVFVDHGPDEDLSLAVCLETRNKVTLDLKRKVGPSSPEVLVSFSVGNSNQNLKLKAQGCTEKLLATEVNTALQNGLLNKYSNIFVMLFSTFQQARVMYLSSEMSSKLLQKIKTILNLLIESRQQVPRM
jgi:hypothetical protein